MQFSSPLLQGLLIQRYKRFFADIELLDGTVIRPLVEPASGRQVLGAYGTEDRNVLDIHEDLSTGATTQLSAEVGLCKKSITAHCPNTGSMQGVLIPGSSVWVTQSNDPKRKLKYTWELVEMDGTYVGVNTQNPNRIVGDALMSGYIPQLAKYETIQAEVKYGVENSRIDYMLTDKHDNRCYVEVKNAHYSKIERGDRIGIFPDSKTTRGVKHLHELMRMVDQGHRAVLIYCLQRIDCESLRFGVEFDPVYAKTAVMALKHGVEMLPYSCAVTLNGITLYKPLNLIVEIE